MKTYARWLGRILAISILLNFLIELISRKSFKSLIGYLTESPFVFFLNTLIIILPFTVVFVVRRKIFACMILSLTWLGTGIINGILLIFRTTPFTGSDLSLIKSAISIAGMYFTWYQMILMAVAAVLVVMGCILLWRTVPASRDKVRYGTGICIIAAAFIIVVGSITGAMKAEVVAVRFGNLAAAYHAYGFPYCFANSLFNTGIPKPDNYSTEAMEVIQEEELMPQNTYLLDEETKPNVIMVQLESFFDPSLWINSKLDHDPIPFFRQLQKNYPSGYLSVPSVGAGTANTEFESITGMNLDFFGPGEYPYKTVLTTTPCESVAFDLKNIGYKAHAIHNNEGTFYDRHTVFSQLGFDTFTPIEYMNNIERNPTGWCKDKILTGEIINALDSTEGPDYIYTISVQGHGKYPDFQYYCEQIEEMDQFIRALVNTLRTRQEPIVLVLYGDHLPGFEWNEVEMRNGSLYQTQYVVWNNMNLPNEKKNVESYQLAAHVLDMVGIHEGTMMRFHQKYFNGGRRAKKIYLEDMKALEYDILYGDREVYHGVNPYDSTELQMGINPIAISKVVFNDSNILVFGENFTHYSQICLNGKQVETTFVWPELIIAKDVPEKKGNGAEISVKQIGRDKAALGEEIFPNE